LMQSLIELFTTYLPSTIGLFDLHECQTQGFGVVASKSCTDCLLAQCLFA